MDKKNTEYIKNLAEVKWNALDQAHRQIQNDIPTVESLSSVDV